MTVKKFVLKFRYSTDSQSKFMTHWLSSDVIFIEREEKRSGNAYVRLVSAVAKLASDNSIEISHNATKVIAT